jgi:hypothetical protein
MPGPMGTGGGDDRVAEEGCWRRTCPSWTVKAGWALAGGGQAQKDGELSVRSRWRAMRLGLPYPLDVVVPKVTLDTGGHQIWF